MTVRVCTDDFDISSECRKLVGTNSDVGAIVTFTGTVREMSAQGRLQSMTLEHYPGMTERELERVEAEAHRRWPLHATCIIHRIGELRPGDNIVLVIAASAHRQAAFEAAAFIMDYLKTDAPFWKKEALLDGTGAWVDARDSDTTARDRWKS